MNTTLAERLKTARRAAQISQKKLGELVGVSQAAIQKIEVGEAKNSTKLIDISKALGVRPEWLSDGSGPMRLPHHPDSTIPPESEWGTVDAWDSNTPLPNDEVEVPFYKDIELAAGGGSCCNEDFNGFKLRFSKSTLRRVGANTDGSGVICFPARGNSMEPVIPDGATVAVDTDNKRIVDGEIYAIDHGGLKRVKQLYRKPGGKILIRSFNRDEYQDEEVNESDSEVIGFVFWYSVIRYSR